MRRAQWKNDLLTHVVVEPVNVTVQVRLVQVVKDVLDVADAAEATDGFDFFAKETRKGEDSH